MINEHKRAQADHSILDVLADRYSPYAYDPRPVEPDKLLSCLEAARWAASSYNEQPWSFIVAERDNEDEFARMLECLVEANQEWAKHAGVLMLTVTARNFTRNGKPNRMAEHDIGLAMGNFSAQATALGLAVHQMAGINPSKARSTYSIPDSHDPLTAVAVGYVNLSPADPQLAERERMPRSRKSLDEIVFRGGMTSSG